MVWYRSIATTLIILGSSAVSALDLSGTYFEKAAAKHGLDAELVYSVALAESAFGRGKNTIAPWPWAIRSPAGPHYENSKIQAKEKLQQLQNLYGNNIDVGVMQINLHWHGDKVRNAADLLDPQKNIDVGAEILSTCIQSAPGDLALGIGRYNNWVDEERARNYADRILAIYRNLELLNKGI